jgi:hypothetical protein
LRLLSQYEQTTGSSSTTRKKCTARSW